MHKKLEKYLGVKFSKSISDFLTILYNTNNNSIQLLDKEMVENILVPIPKSDDEVIKYYENWRENISNRQYKKLFKYLILGV